MLQIIGTRGEAHGRLGCSKQDPMLLTCGGGGG